MSNRTIYICDGTKCDAGSNLSCLCKHTTDISHARYNKHEYFERRWVGMWEVEHDELLTCKDFECMKGAPTMAKYRKKPVIIEAYQTDKELDIDTLEGVMHASVGDYIITGVHGEHYPCKPDIFEETYEKVED